MAFIFGDNLTLADRWHNTKEWEALLRSNVPFSVESGVIEMALDRTKSAFFVQNVGGPRTYTPCLVDDSHQVNVTGNGATNGLGEATTIIKVFSDEGDGSRFSDDFFFMYFRSDGAFRTRVVRLESFQFLAMTGGPNPLVFKTRYSPAIVREQSSTLIKHRGVNDIGVGGTDTVNMASSPGDAMYFANITCMPGFRAPTFLETSSGASTLFRFDDSNLRGNTACIDMFGAGPTALQPLGKRLQMYNTNLRAVYDQPPGAEIAGLGGNGVYHHPGVELTWDGGEGGNPGGGVDEWIPERAIYINGNSSGTAPARMLIKNVTLWENCYWGIKTAGNAPVYVQDSTIKSRFRAILNEGAWVEMDRVTFTGGLISSGQLDQGPNVRITLRDCPISADYAVTESQYWTGVDGNPDTSGALTEIINGSVTLERCPITSSAARYVGSSAKGLTESNHLIARDTTVTAVGAGPAAFGAWLVATGGSMTLERCTVSGQIRPFNWTRPAAGTGAPGGETAKAIACNFASCTVAPRIQVDNASGVDHSYTTLVDSDTTLPDLAVAIAGTQFAKQAWEFRGQDRQSTVASASTLTVFQGADRVTVSGTSTINTINLSGTLSANFLVDGATICLRASGAWKFGTAGNITPLNTNARSVGALVLLRYNATTSKWVEIVDDTAPVFGGVVTVNQTLGFDSLTVSWSAARDTGTETASINYLVYVATSAGGQSFAGVPAAVVVGSTTATLSSLPSGVEHFIVVRARDSTGNVDGNRIESSARTRAQVVRAPKQPARARIALARFLKNN